MSSSGHDRIRTLVQAVSARPDESGGLVGMPTPIEQVADTAATDWQIIVHLKTLFERDPALISALVADSSNRGPVAHVATLLLAAREALSACPDSADLHYHAAGAAARSGRRHEAKELLKRALELDRHHVKALVLLADVCLGLGEPHRAKMYLQRALSVRSACGAALPSGGRDGRGNELPA